MTASCFQFGFQYSAQKDIGKRRSSNQDEVVLCPDIGLFAVSDGMGGLADGGKASGYVRDSIPLMMRLVHDDARSAKEAGGLLAENVRLVSDKLFDSGNISGHTMYGATLCALWLFQDKAVFVNLGDSRAYVLPKYKKKLRQITEDHNFAAVLVRNGELTKEQARTHPSSSRLTRFVGMGPAALPEHFICDVSRGDRILLCSDGLYGMVEERDMARIMRSSRSPEIVCSRLIDKANENGGRDNISAVYVRIVK